MNTPINLSFDILAPMKIGASMRLFPRENYLKKIRGFYHDDGMIKVVTGVPPMRQVLPHAVHRRRAEGQRRR